MSSGAVSLLSFPTTINLDRTFSECVKSLKLMCMISMRSVKVERCFSTERD